MGHLDRHHWEQVKMLYNDIACLMHNFSKLGASWNYVLKNVRGGRKDAPEL